MISRADFKFLISLCKYLILELTARLTGQESSSSFSLCAKASSLTLQQYFPNCILMFTSAQRGENKFKVKFKSKLRKHQDICNTRELLCLRMPPRLQRSQAGSQTYLTTGPLCWTGASMAVFCLWGHILKNIAQYYSFKVSSPESPKPEDFPSFARSRKKSHVYACKLC